MSTLESHRCEVCGNEYEGSFRVQLAHEDHSHWFDSFECAIQRLAPMCLHCGVKIVGHGVQAGEQVYCCAHCARMHGEKNLVDHSKGPSSMSTSGIY